MKTDILDELFVEEGEINKELMHGIVVDYARLTKEGGIIPLEKFNTLNARNKVMIILVAKRVLSVKGISSDFASPKEIQELSGLPGGTVCPLVRDLQSRGLLKNEGGKYKIPNYSISRLKAMLSEQKERKYRTVRKIRKKMKTVVTGKKKPSIKRHPPTQRGYGPILKKMIEEGFFNTGPKGIDEIVRRLNEMGYNIYGKKVGAVAQALTFLCRDSETDLERRPVPEDKKKRGEKWCFCLKGKNENNNKRSQ